MYFHLDTRFMFLFHFSENALSKTFVDRGNYTVFVKRIGGGPKVECDKPLLYNNPPDSNIRR